MNNAKIPHLCEDVLDAVAARAPPPGPAPAPLERAYAAHAAVAGLGRDGRVAAAAHAREAEVEAGEAGALLLEHAVHVAAVAESDGELVHQHPDEDEEEAAHEGEQGEGGLEGVAAVAEDGEVEDLRYDIMRTQYSENNSVCDLVEAAPEAGEDDAAVVELPGEQQQPLLGPDAQHQQQAGQQPHEGDDQHRAHHRQRVHHRLHLQPGSSQYLYVMVQNVRQII